MKKAQSKPNKEHKKKGIPTWKIVLPIAIILFILHTVVAGSMVVVSRASNTTTDILRTYSGYTNEITEIQATASRLNETSFSFLLRPTVAVTPQGPVLNLGPLYAYIEALKTESRAETIVKKFEDRKFGKTIMTKLNASAENANSMIPIQLHAIALVFSVYDMPDLDTLAPENRDLLEYLQTKLPNIPDDELAIPPEGRLDLVVDLISGSEYSTAKRQVSLNITGINKALQSRMQTESETQLKKVSLARIFLFFSTIAIVFTLLFVFFLLIRLLVVPLHAFVRNIDEGTKLPDNQGLAEVQLVARSYNAMMKRRNALENVLRSAAEIDPLTNLPNRYHMEQYLLQDDEEGTSQALFLFDVNFLKDTNDKKGHSAGDELLQRAAKCIYASFSAFSAAKCFRYGGDEFVAILKNCSKDDIESILQRFAEEQSIFNVSIAVGYAWTPDITRTSVKSLFDEADEKMYQQKKQMHGEREYS